MAQLVPLKITKYTQYNTRVHTAAPPLLHIVLRKTLLASVWYCTSVGVADGGKCAVVRTFVQVGEGGCIMFVKLGGMGRL